MGTKELQTMDCVVCGHSEMQKIQHKVFKCAECKHTYIAYDGDGLHYHKVLYRAEGQEGIRTPGEIIDGKFTD